MSVAVYTICGAVLACVLLGPAGLFPPAAAFWDWLWFRDRW